jgi:hypothetical protein
VKSGARLLTSNSSVELLVLAPVGVANSNLLVVDTAVSQEALLSIDFHQHIIDVLVGDILVVIIIIVVVVVSFDIIGDRLEVIIVIISLLDSLWG